MHEELHTFALSANILVDIPTAEIQAQYNA